MKSKLIALSLGLVLSMSYSNFVFAQVNKTANTEAAPHVATAEEAKTLSDVGNKICPVSGEKVPGSNAKGEMGKAVKFVYNEKIYNLCCPMCIKDFKKNPGKYSAIAEKEVKETK